MRVNSFISIFVVAINLHVVRRLINTIIKLPRLYKLSIIYHKKNAKTIILHGLG
jgi:hypothetical protein